MSQPTDTEQQQQLPSLPPNINTLFDEKTKELKHQFNQLLNELSHLEHQLQQFSSSSSSTLSPTDYEDFQEKPSEENEKNDESSLKARIDSMYSELQDLQQEISLRTFAKKSFFQYFSSQVVLDPILSSLPSSISSLSLSLSSLSSNMKDEAEMMMSRKRQWELNQIFFHFSNEIFAKGGSGEIHTERKHVENLEQLTWYITGLNKVQFENKLKQMMMMMKNGVVVASASDGENGKIRLKQLKLLLKSIKESLMQAQREQKVLQATKLRIESQEMNSMSSGSRSGGHYGSTLGGIGSNSRYSSIYSNRSVIGRGSGSSRGRGRGGDTLSSTGTTLVLKQEFSMPFEMNVLLADLEMYHFHIQDLRWRMNEVQEEIDILVQQQQSSLSASAESSSLSKKNVKSFSGKKLKKPVKKRGNVGDGDGESSEEEEDDRSDERDKDGTTENSDWTNYLNFDQFKHEKQKELFLESAERRMYVRNESIRKQFEQSVHFHRADANYMKLYSDPYFWRVWYEKRKVHEYANMLNQKYNGSGIDDDCHHRSDHQQTVLNADMLLSLSSTAQNMNMKPIMVDDDSKRGIDEYHSMFFFDEELIPTIDFHRIYSPLPSSKKNDQTTTWRDSYYRYVYRQAPVERNEQLDNDKQVNGSEQNKPLFNVRTRDDPKLWFQVYQTRLKVLRLLLVKPTSTSSKDYKKMLKQAYDNYVYALCRISTQIGVVSNILSKYLSSRIGHGKKTTIQSEGDEDETHEIVQTPAQDKSNTQKAVKQARVSLKKHSTVSQSSQQQRLLQLLQQKRALYVSTRGVIAKYISDWLSRILKVRSIQYRRKKRYKFIMDSQLNPEKQEQQQRYSSQENRLKQSINRFIVQSYRYAALCNPNQVHRQVKFYRGLLCTVLRSKLLSTSASDKFWTSLEGQTVLNDWPEIEDDEEEDRESSYKAILYSIVQEEVDAFQFIQMPLDEIDQRTIEKYINDYDRRFKMKKSSSSSSSVVDTATTRVVLRKKEDGTSLVTHPATSINQCFNASNNDVSISSILLDETEEQLASRISRFVQLSSKKHAMSGGPVKLEKKHVASFARNEIKYLVNDKHYTMFSGGLFKCSTSNEPAFLPLTEYVSLEKEKQELAKKLHSMTDLDEKLNIMRNEVARLKTREQFLDLKLRTTTTNPFAS